MAAVAVHHEVHLMAYTGLSHASKNLLPKLRIIPSSNSRGRIGSSSITCKSHSPGGVRNDVERKRKQIVEDGFAVFQKLWSQEEILAAAGGSSAMVGKRQKEVLECFISNPSDVVCERELLHPQGFRCTDDVSTSPEPWWHQSWQVDGLECGDDLDLLQTPPWVATLVISLSDITQRKSFGGVAVFPRSHWLIQDWIATSAFNRTSLPHPSDVPAAAPIELELGCGDMVLLHPWLACTFAPNVSASSANLLIIHIGDSASKGQGSRNSGCEVVVLHTTPSMIGKFSVHAWRSSSEGSENMWRGWLPISQYVIEEFLNVEGETNQLQQEEVKAQLGGWQEDLMTDLPSGLCTLKPALRTRVAPRDFVAWCLQNSTIEFIQDKQWKRALSMLQRLAGLRPNCYWVALQAGQCCLKSAPAGQLGGRAGRKCMLEDGERFLLRAIEIAPGWPLAYAELTKCLSLMGRGRELEIPGVVDMMKRKCDLEQLCSQYPTASSTLQTSSDVCAAMMSLCSEKNNSLSEP